MPGKRLVRSASSASSSTIALRDRFDRRASSSMWSCVLAPKRTVKGSLFVRRRADRCRGMFDSLIRAMLDHAVGAPAESGADEMDKLFTAGA